MNSLDAIVRAVEHLGGPSACAGVMRVTPSAVSQWLSGGRPIPADRCPAIERASGGAAKCEDLREDLSWVRIPDPGWPWHPLGRPALDVAAAAPQEEDRAAA